MAQVRARAHPRPCLDVLHTGADHANPFAGDLESDDDDDADTSESRRTRRILNAARMILTANFWTEMEGVVQFLKVMSSF